MVCTLSKSTDPQVASLTRKLVRAAFLTSVSRGIKYALTTLLVTVAARSLHVWTSFCAIFLDFFLRDLPGLLSARSSWTSGLPSARSSWTSDLFLLRVLPGRLTSSCSVYSLVVNFDSKDAALLELGLLHQRLLHLHSSFSPYHNTKLLFAIALPTLCPMCSNYQGNVIE